jgi:hypothetical protein
VCDAGYFCNTTGLTAALLCPAGFACSNSPTLHPVRCDPSTSTPAGATQCASATFASPTSSSTLLIVVSVVAAIVVVSGFMWYFCFKKTNSMSALDSVALNEIGGMNYQLLSPPPAALHPVEVLDLGRGRITDLVLVAQGAFGAVFKGRYNEMDVAVKQSIATDVNAQMAQMDEIRLLAALPPHPNVLTLLGAYVDEGCVCNVTPFLPGGSLLDYMRTHHPRTALSTWLTDPAHVTTVVCGMFNGLAHLHAHGVLHRDGARLWMLMSSLPLSRPSVH